MEEHSLNPGDNIAEWTVKEHVANGCIYAVTRKDDPELYALKLREPQNKNRFHKEIEVLQRLNKEGGHPSFQQLHDYDEERLFMILTYVNPKYEIKELCRRDPEGILDTISPRELTLQIAEALNFALDRKVLLTSRDVTLFIKNGRPFFVDVEGPSINKYSSRKQILLERFCCYQSPVDTLFKMMVYQEYLSKE